METRKGMSFFIIFIVIVLLVIMIASAYKAHGIHQERQLKVMNQFIKETARNCYLRGYCEGQITLGDLYKLMNIEQIINPVTNEYLDDEMCINLDGANIIFC